MRKSNSSNGPRQAPEWLRRLPLAPEFQPTPAEFADPIAFISRIEPLASAFGICKIIPPLPLSSPANLPSSFATRFQQLGRFSSSTPSPLMQVMESGSSYSPSSFDSKSRAFSHSLFGPILPSPLSVESLFWEKATSDKPIYVEYANDVPGSCFTGPDEPFTYHPHRKRQKRYKAHGPRLKKSLSYGPWNLQAIARAPGSLTRFMPDDIPGVTSPMVYIAMLFSWFAWHVEDHELHSLNFLHVGAPKSWYAVPGERAADFEEVVRVRGYGESMDHIVSLATLGEKTTLLSPEVITDAGLPCCRLVQYPGQFVITFPRAYHVGFSHGFNCGEAANFATPQWLKFAKDAAIRRAVMNYLPMLSHQQLLYLIAISFISRTPRELLLGARASRLRDRNEERELLVKKAFLQDIMNENNLLCTLLERKSILNPVLWEPDLLPSPYPGPNHTLHGTKDCGSNCGVQGMTESMNDPEMGAGIDSNTDSSADSLARSFDQSDTDNDDLPFDLSIESGSLTCIACGVLGYPFMAIIQPLTRSFQDIVVKISQCSGPLVLSPGYVSTIRESHTQESVSLHQSIGEAKDACLEALQEADELLGLQVEDPKHNVKWSIDCHFWRPRIFCLQHALEVEKLLDSKGGANVLLICHSDYLKIKALAIFISEEIGLELNCKDVTLKEASPFELHLINISIDDENHEEDGREWTSSLGVNLSHFIKLKKQQPQGQNELVLKLRGLFSGQSASAISNLKWLHKKFRTPYKIIGNVRSRIQSHECRDMHYSQLRSNDSVRPLIVYQRRRRKALISPTLDDSLLKSIPTSVIDKKPELYEGAVKKDKADLDHSNIPGTNRQHEVHNPASGSQYQSSDEVWSGKSHQASSSTLPDSL